MLRGVVEVWVGALCQRSVGRKELRYLKRFQSLLLLFLFIYLWFCCDLSVWLIIFF